MANLRLRGRRIVVSRLTSARDNTTAARERLRSRMVTRVKGMRDAVESRRLQLRALSPLATLDRGYAVAEYSDGVVTDAAQLAPGQQLRVRLRRGRVDSTVDAVHVDPA